MPTQPPPVSAPLTFDLPVALIAKAAAVRRREKLGSTSAVVRLAIREFDFGAYVADSDEHRQVSVRLAPRVKNFLVRTARKKGVSVGELVRAAMEALPAASQAKR